MTLDYHIVTEVHIYLHRLICYFEETYPIFDPKYSYNKWQDAIMDYLDVNSIEQGCSYALYRPNHYTPDHWINQYIMILFHDYFPDFQRIYIDD
jgi:hypothetical protein